MEFETRKNNLNWGDRNNFLLDASLSEALKEEDTSNRSTILNFLGELNIPKKIISPQILKENKVLINKNIKENEKPILEKFFLKINCKSLLESKEKPLIQEKKDIYPIKLLSTPGFSQRKIVQSDFVKHFRDRFEKLKEVLEKQGLENLTTIRKVKGSKGSFNIIGMVSNKRITKNKNIIVEIEDLTGSLSILINKNKEELYENSKELVPDEVLAFNISNNGSFIYCNDFVRPSVVLAEKKKFFRDCWVAFISDIHCGSTFFLEKNFLKFIKWLNGAENSESSKTISSKIKYLFIGGDLIDGVSHYPGQDKYLTIFTSRGQYEKLAEYLKLIRKDIQVVACSGNHDSVWVGEPQPAISKRWAESLYNIENLLLVSNPAMIEIIGGFRILMYHGASMYHYMNEMPRLRLKYGLDFPEVYVAEMLKRRHLSPMHGAVDYVPCEEDSLVIDKVPDIILTGDIHRAGVAMHNNILSIAGSCWQANTPFFDKVGIHPDPCKVTLFNLKTREIKMLDFSSEDSSKELKVDGEKNEQS